MKRLRKFRRYRQVVNILTRHGFGFFINWAAWLWFRINGKEPQHQRTTPERIRMAMEDLGATYVKLGQMLSTRPDIVPKELLVQLEMLQDKVQPLPFNRIEQVLREEGIEIEAVFTEFAREPVASASIGQVHRARLKDGKEVAVKVQRPGVRQLVDDDLSILLDLARMAEKRTRWGRLYRVVEIVEEFSIALRGELDFTREGNNADHFRQDFKGNHNVLVPDIVWAWSTNRVLVMQYLHGIKVSDLDRLKESGADLKVVASRIIDALFTQVYDKGFFHADPHPGNIAVAPGNRIVFYDFGQVGRIDMVLRENAMDLVLSMVRYDVNGVMNNLLALGISDTGRIQREVFRKDVARLQRKYYGLPMSKIHIGEALQELVELTMKHQVRMPAELALIIKMLMTMESLVAALDPDLSIVEIAEPFGRKIVKQRYSPGRIKDRARDTALDYIDFSRAFPQRVTSILEQLEDGDLGIDIEITNARDFYRMVDLTSNRLSVAIVTAALIIGSSLAMISSKRTSVLAQIPLAEIGFILSFLMGLFLVYSVVRRYDP